MCCVLNPELRLAHCRFNLHLFAEASHVAKLNTVELGIFLSSSRRKSKFTAKGHGHRTG